MSKAQIHMIDMKVRQFARRSPYSDSQRSIRCMSGRHPKGAFVNWHPNVSCASFGGQNQ
jgi:hypothetical protein